MKKFILLLFVISFHKITMADECVFTSGAEKSITINANTISIPVNQNIPVGGTLFSQDYQYDSLGGHQAWMCGDDGSFVFYYETYMSGSQSTVANTFDTNLAGIGIRVSIYSSPNNWSMPTTPTAAPSSTQVILSNGKKIVSYTTSPDHLVVELIKTANEISAGNLVYSIPDFSFAHDSNQLKLASFNFNAAIAESSCSVNSQTLSTLDLGTTSESALPQPGSTSNKKDFSIILDCNGSTNVNISLSGTEDPFALNKGVLAPDESSSAAGLGTQILYNDVPVKFNEAFSVGMSENGQFSIPMSAQFYRTQDNLTAGQFSALMTYTLTYL